MPKTINLQLNKKIYKLKAIKETIDFYKDIADFKLCSKKAYFKVSMTVDDGFQVREIKKEFLNAILIFLQKCK